MTNKTTLSFVVLILSGVAMAVLVLVKLLRHIFIDSDWFWFIAAISLIVEGAIFLKKEIKFNNKHIIIKKDSKEHKIIKKYLYKKTR